MSIGDLEDRIKQHDAGVRKNPRDRVCYRRVCAGCGKKAPFALHGLRKRSLRYIVANRVVCTVILLARWRCRRCGRSFTDHPPFVLPYKRFAAPCLLSLAGRYLHEHRATYRSVVRHACCLIGYPIERRDAHRGQAETSGEQQATPLQAGDHQAVVPPSLVWRMATWLGGLSLVLDKARQMVFQHNPQSLCHRVDGSVASRKARTLERLDRLQTARQLLLVMPEWEECFGRKFFPQFATRSGFD